MVGSTSDRSTNPGGACESTPTVGDGPVGGGVGLGAGGGADGGAVPVEHAVSAAHAASAATATRTGCTRPVYHPARIKRCGSRQGRGGGVGAGADRARGRGDPPAAGEGGEAAGE